MENIAISKFKQMRMVDFQNLHSPKLIVNYTTGEELAVLVPYEDFVRWNRIHKLAHESFNASGISSRTLTE